MSGFNLDLFDAGDRNTTRKLSKVDSQIVDIVESGNWEACEELFGFSVPERLRSKEHLPEIKRFVNEQLQDRTRHEIFKTIYWPKPYGKIEDNRYGARFTVEGDVKPYLGRVRAIDNYLEMGMEPIFCIQAQLQIPMNEFVLQRKLGSGELSEEEGRTARKRIKESMDCFLHYTILSYIGYFKSLQREKQDTGQEELAGEYRTAIDVARELAIETTVEAVKVYNKDRDIKTETIDEMCAQGGDAYRKALEMIDEISELFADHFYDPRNEHTRRESLKRRLQYFQAMQREADSDHSRKRYGMKDVLKKLEQKTELHDSVSNVPNFFSNMLHRFYYIITNGIS